MIIMYSSKWGIGKNQELTFKENVPLFETLYISAFASFESLCRRRFDNFLLFLLLGANDNGNEVCNICPMTGLTKGKLNVWLWN